MVRLHQGSDWNLKRNAIFIDPLKPWWCKCLCCAVVVQVSTENRSYASVYVLLFYKRLFENRTVTAPTYYCRISTSDPAKHAIPKTVEVAYSVGQLWKRLRRRGWLTIWNRDKIPRYIHKLMHRKRVTCELHDSYFRSMMIKHAIPKTAEVAYSVGQLWEEIEWA